MIVRHQAIDATPAQRERDAEEAAYRCKIHADLREVMNCVICAAAGAAFVLLAQYIWAAA